MIRSLLLLLLTFSVTLFAQEKNKSIGFAENKGQIVDQKGKPNPNVKFLLNSRGLNVQLRKNGFSYDVYETRKVALTEGDLRKRRNLNLDETEKKNLPDYSLEAVNHRVDIDFEGSNAGVVMEGSGKSRDYDNYYTVKHAPEGVLMVHKFDKVTYKNLYPNVDVVFFVPVDSTKVVEYNFIVRPGGKVGDIKMKFNGVKTHLEDSKIKMETRFGVMEETLPLSWTEAGGARNEVAVGYKKISKNVYGFDFEESQVSGKTVVIDPVPVRLWGTYYANDNSSTTQDLITDIANNVYIKGSTTSTNNVATVGTHLSVFDWNQNCFFAKIDGNGVRIWGTYYSVQGNSMIIDHNFNLVFSGSLFHDEINITSPNCYQPEKNSLNDMYIVKLNSLGIREWGTYYGGSHNDNANAVNVDSSNNIYVGGQSSSTNAYLTTPNSFQQISNVISSEPIGILIKFSAAGQRLWATFYGGRIFNIDISSDDSLYITGVVFENQNSNIATSGTYMTTPSEYCDSFITKFDVSGQRIWGTFLGISGYDTAYASKLIGSTLYILGATYAQNGVATPGTFYPTYSALEAAYTYWAPIEPCYIMKFDLISQEKVWCTYFFDTLSSIDANNNGEVYAAGYSSIESGIATSNGFMPEKGDYIKGYFFKLDSQGQRVWGSYFGGDKAEQFVKVRLDYAGDIYLSGTTFGSSIGITTSPGMISSTNVPNNISSFLVKFKDCLSSVTVSSNSPVCVGGTVELTANGGTTYSWTGPNGFISSVANPTIPMADVVHSGTYSCAISGTGACNDTLSVVVAVGNDSFAPVPDVANLPTLTGECNNISIPVPTATDACLGSVSGTTSSPLTYTQVGTYTIIWNYTDGTNTSSQNQTIVISAQPLPVAVGLFVFCKQNNATLNNLVVSGQDIKWYDALTNGTLLPNATLLVNGTTYYVSQTINGCESERVAVVATVYETAAPTGMVVQTFCDTQVLTLADFVVSGTDLLFYDGSVGGNLLPTSTTLVNGFTYYASQTLNGCESIARLALVPDIISGVPANDFSELMCDDLDDGIETVDLSDYNGNLIANTSAYTFKYYTSFIAAENEVVSITGFSNYTLSTGLNTIYVRVEFANSCYEVVALELTVIELPKLNMKDSYSVCENGFVTITADAGFDSYSWSTGATSQAIVVTNGGNYWVTVTKNTNGLVCSSTKNITVEVSQKATITAVETVDWTSNDNVITVYVDGSGVYEYSVDGINFQSSNQFFGLPNGEYTVYVNDTKGCGVAKKDVYLLMYPKYFTPNGDSYNDFWGIQFYQNEMNLVVKIFDRYGKFIKQLNAKDPIWDGTYEGNNLPATDYWFTVIREDGTEYNGHFTLKR